MYRPLMSCIPFLTCLFWFIQYAINYKKKDLAKRMYMWFLATCVVLYFCHYLFFTVGLSHPMECLWTLCSLSVYPLFYAYIYRLTSRSLATSRLAQILLPGAIVAFCKFLFPGDEMNMVQKIVNSIQITSQAHCETSDKWCHQDSNRGHKDLTRPVLCSTNKKPRRRTARLLISGATRNRTGDTRT